MSPARHGGTVTRCPSHAAVYFLVLTFLITWGITGLYVLAPGRAAAWFGPISGSHPLFFLATWAPALSAFALVQSFGGAGLPAFLSRLLLWRSQAAWAAFLLLGPPLVLIGGSLIKGGPVLAQLPPAGAGPVVALIFMMLFLGPVEEFGWRMAVTPPPAGRRASRAIFALPWLSGSTLTRAWSKTARWDLPDDFAARSSRRDRQPRGGGWRLDRRRLSRVDGSL